MSDNSAIEWTDSTWNPIVGCSIVSPGCTNCYAMRMAARIIAMAGERAVGVHYDRTVRDVNGNAVWTGVVKEAPDGILTAPLRWKKPRRIFVNSMGDLFHEAISDEQIDRVFAIMALCPRHTFQVLTKRAERMRDYFSRSGRHNDIELAAENIIFGSLGGKHILPQFPLPNVWLGVSAEDQERADERIPLLLQTPATVRFVSCEPLLGPIVLHPLADGTNALTSSTGPNLDWVIVGGESGPKSRPMHPAWARSLRHQCRAASVPFFFKQWGEWAPIEAFDMLESRDVNRQYRTALVQPDGKRLFDVDDLDLSGCDFHIASRFTYRVGKHRAGRLLDGVEHNAFPQVSA